MHAVAPADNDPTGVRFDADIKRRLKEIALAEPPRFGLDLDLEAPAGAEHAAEVGLPLDTDLRDVPGLAHELPDVLPPA